MPLLIGLVLSIQEIPNHINLKNCKVQIQEETTESALTIVTNAKNVKEGMRVVVATVGTELEDIGVVESKVVGGVKSSGFFCDSKMCGWGSINPGLAVNVSDSFLIGSEAPAQNPRSVANAESSNEMTLKEMKEAEKAARKAAVKEKRAEKAAAKKEKS